MFNRRILLATDLDGTLIPKFGDVHEKDLLAIDKFVSLGGLLTIATGRSPEISYEFVKRFKINVPIISCNGGLIYDFNDNKTLFRKDLNNTYKDVLIDLINKFHNVGIEAITDENVFIARDCKYFERHHRVLGDRCINTTIDKFPNNPIKAILAGEDEDIKEVLEYTTKFNIKGIEFLLSAPSCFEILPEGISKGEGLKVLVDKLNIHKDNIYAIGDYYNDVSMLKYATHSASFIDSPDEIKDLCEFICNKCINGGFSEFIEYIIEKNI